MVMCVNVDVAMYQTLVATVVGADDVMVTWIMGQSDRTNSGDVRHDVSLLTLVTNYGDVSLVAGQVVVTAVMMCH